MLYWKGLINFFGVYVFVYKIFCSLNIYVCIFDRVKLLNFMIIRVFLIYFSLYICCKVLVDCRLDISLESWEFIWYVFWNMCLVIILYWVLDLFVYIGLILLFLE